MNRQIFICFLFLCTEYGYVKATYACKCYSCLHSLFLACPTCQCGFPQSTSVASQLYQEYHCNSSGNTYTGIESRTICTHTDFPSKTTNSEDKSIVHGQHITQPNHHYHKRHEGAFWQLTDIHFDPWYYKSQESCNKPIPIVGEYGDFECDAAWATAHSSIQAMRDLPGGSEVDFILWSGDNPPHIKKYEEFMSTEVIMEITRNLTNLITSVFPDKLVLPVLGNHDWYPTNQFPGNGSPTYDMYAEIWKMWLNTTAIQKTFKKGGYYTLMLNEPKKIRAVVWNNNLYLTSNKMTTGQTDPGGQYAWFEAVMTQARASGEKVHVFTHIPPGKVPEEVTGAAWFHDNHNTRQVELYIKYSDVIQGMYSAHAHHDIFKIFYKDGKPVNSMLLPPSITPLRYIYDKVKDRGTARNPALRLVLLDNSTYELKDVKQYSLDLRKANAGSPEWKLLYTFSETYGVANVSTKELQKVLEKLKQDKSLYKTFQDLFTVDTQHYGNDNFDCRFKSTFLCSVQYQIYSEFDACFQKQEYCTAVSMAVNLFGSVVVVMFTSLIVLIV